jgi:hypothetical protein
METLRLRDDVREAVIDGTLMLQSKADLHAVKVSRSAAHLLPLLKSGATLDELCDVFGPRLSAAQRAQVEAFVSVLRRAGLLQHGEKGARPALVRYATLDLSVPLARLGDALRGSRTAAGLAFVSALLAACALIWGVSVVLPHLVELGRTAAHVPAAAVGLLVVLVLVIPVHELAHALAAGACGLRTTRLVLARRGALPTVFCETPGSSLIADRAVRILIPAAGPAVDLAFGLAFGALALAHPTPATPYLAAASCASLMALLLDFNPYSGSDGSRMIEIVLDDDHARSSALSSRRGIAAMCLSARCYLAVAIVYLAGVVVGIGELAVAVYRASAS